MDFFQFCQEHPQFFAQSNIELPQSARQAMIDFVESFYSFKKTPLFLEKIGILHHGQDSPNLKTDGVLMGFDFHLNADSEPQLIEINTNAGGAFLNVALLFKNGKNEEAKRFKKNLIAMFLKEWQLFSEDCKTLENVAIVDELPQSQFLYPEFTIARNLFEEMGIACEIAAPSDFEIQNNALILNGKKIDLVYNRLTDFYLNDSKNAVLKRAFAENLACISPNPAHYALVAKKNNLMILRSFENFKKMIPAVQVLDSEDFWNQRKSLFFKPVEGFGSRAVYRGDKITKKVFAEILNKHYLAQTLVPPSLHKIMVNGQEVLMKADIRAFVYQNKVLHFAARLYVGQTTNFRTPGGGFALCV